MAEFYESQDIPIRFDVFKDGQNTTPGFASVVVYDPDKEYILKENAKVSGSEVRYVLKGKNVEKIGKYIFVFKVRVKELGDYTHIVEAKVQKLPVPIREGK